ncbi:hypothetical protein Tsubulata_002227 [Turnera subulata]|uniref:Uncharacterized protein n=1 Tax=Turnera subulata TaxID=218843 RepID=A0A9Q0F9C4_9ROSI|nr:hypothetical protein Tsubulata_002227 [Turnera subulata]
MRPPSLHSNFFSSLKQVEKRLKLETPPPPPHPHPQPLNVSTPTPPPPPLSPPQLQPSIPETNLSSTESLSTPLHLHIDEEPNNGNTSSTLQGSSEAPMAFLSCSQRSSRTQQNPVLKPDQCQPKAVPEPESDELDDIERLMQLLGLADIGRGNGKEGGEKERFLGDVPAGDGECRCGCDGGFYEKIVGVKGPKCKKEVERLDGWIRCFLGNGKEEKREPLKLAFLLLGKAAYESESGGGGFGALEFPATIQEFLKFDPPGEY